MTLETLQVLIEAQTKEFRDELKKVQSQVKTMSNSVNTEVNKVKNVFKGLGRFVAALGIGKLFADSTKQAMKVEAAIQQISRTMGESTNQFLKWSKANALAFNMSQSDALSYGATFSNLLASFISDTDTLTNYTTQLLKASSVIASGTGRTMDDVMERIRSGLLGNTEAIEDLGINVNVAMLESTEAFKKFANGKSWNQLDFQTQQQIRLFGILEQTSKKFGNEVFNNTNSSLQQLVAVLKDCALNIGNTFLPIVNVVLPILTSFAMKIREVTSYIATFMQVLFGYTPKTNSGVTGATNQVASLGNAAADTGDKAKKAQKEVNRLLGGFDELNVLNSNSDSDSGSTGTSGVAGGSSGNMGLNSLDMGLSKEIDTSGVAKAAQRVKKIFSDLAKFLKKNRVIILSVVSGLAAGIITALAMIKVPKFISSISTVISGATTGILGLANAIKFVGLKSFLSAFLSLYGPILAVSTAIGLVVGAIVYLWNTSEEFRNIIISMCDDIMNILRRLWDEILVPLGELLLDIFNTVIVPIATFIGTVVVDVVMAAFRVIKSIWDNVLSPLANFLIDVFSITLKAVIEVWEAWKPTVETVFSIIMWIWNNALKPLVNFVADVLCGVFEGYGSTIKDVFGSVKRILKGLIDFIAGVFTGDWERAWEGIKDIFGGIFDGLAALVKAPMNAVIGVINGAIKGINKLSIDIPDWVPGFGGKHFGVNIQSIPYLARGGIVDSPTLAMIGEAGREAVVPLDNNTGWISQLAGQLSVLISSSNNSSSDRPAEFIFQLPNGTKLGKYLFKSLKELERQSGKVIFEG